MCPSMYIWKETAFCDDTAVEQKPMKKCLKKAVAPAVLKDMKKAMQAKTSMATGMLAIIPIIAIITVISDCRGSAIWGSSRRH